MKKEENKELALMKQDELNNKDGQEELSLFEYEKRYVRNENVSKARFGIFVIASFIGIVLLTCLTLLVLKIWDIHMYAGIAAAAVAVLLFIFCFIVPLIKILRSDYFITNVDSRNVVSAKKHNRELRKKLAVKMVDFSASVNGVGWCKDDTCKELEIAVEKEDNRLIKEKLTALYKGPVKADAKRIIRSKSLKCGIYTAISQENKADAAIVAALNFQLVRDLVYLYGFRPSDAKLFRVFTSVLESVLISYGVGKIEVGEKILSSLSKTPFISIFSSLIDSGVQGMANSLLTLKIGYQTIHYLNKEYRLQEILDGVSVDIDLVEEQKEQAVLEQEYDQEKKNLKAIKA